MDHIAGNYTCIHAHGHFPLPCFTVCKLQISVYSSSFTFEFERIIISLSSNYFILLDEPASNLPFAHLPIKLMALSHSDSHQRDASLLELLVYPFESRGNRQQDRDLAADSGFALILPRPCRSLPVPEPRIDLNRKRCSGKMDPSG